MEKKPYTRPLLTAHSPVAFETDCSCPFPDNEHHDDWQDLWNQFLEWLRTHGY